MAEKIRYGLSQVHVAFLDESGTTPDWDTVIAIPGAVKIEYDENGSSNDFFADNGVYAALGSSGGLSGSIELAMFPDSFVAEAMGSRVDSRGGLVEIAGAVKKPFAMGFQVENDESGRRIWLYKVTLSRPKDSHETMKESVEVKTETADFTASPVAIGSENVVMYSLTRTSANATTYDAWFTDVVEPAAVSNG